MPFRWFWTLYKSHGNPNKLQSSPFVALWPMSHIRPVSIASEKESKEWEPGSGVSRSCMQMTIINLKAINGSECISGINLERPGHRYKTDKKNEREEKKICGFWIIRFISDRRRLGDCLINGIQCFQRRNAICNIRDICNDN